METLFRRNPYFNSFIEGNILHLPQKYEGVIFYIFRNMDNTVTVSIASESIDIAITKIESCLTFSANARCYFNDLFRG